MMREETVFGPIRSRRLGSSLGVNLLPRNGKLCNFDCIYCECGWNKDGLGDRTLPSVEDVEEALRAKLILCRGNGTAIDSITFSGDGEPTLHPDFARIIDRTLALRDALFPQARVSVLSNATRIGREDVFRALRKVDNPILKIDAPTDALAVRINRPVAPYHVADVVAAMERFDGEFVLQTMFLRGPAFDSSSPEVLLPWMEIVRSVHPREVMVYTLDREAPAEGLEKMTPDEMAALVEPLVREGFRIQIRG